MQKVEPVAKHFGLVKGIRTFGTSVMDLLISPQNGKKFKMNMG